MAIRTRPMSIVAFMLAIGSNEFLRVDAAADPTPTCESFGTSWYFPNDCVADCTDGSSSTMDIKRSRNVNGNFKCYCVDQEMPLCTDDPMCSDLEILPGSALESCQAMCGSTGSEVTVVDDIEYAGDASAASKNQTHYRVGCSCDGGATQQCGTDYILFSDLTYLKSCTGTGGNSLQINSMVTCGNYCTDTNVFVGGNWNAGDRSCSCIDDQSRSALACDDTKSNFNDGSGLGNPCYENVGVSTVDCSASSSATAEQPTATQTLVSSAAIMGIWMLPW